MNRDEMLKIITDGVELGEAYNIRVNGKLLDRKNSEGIRIETKKDNSGIDIFIADGVTKKSLAIPVVVDEKGLNDKVLNDFFIGENVDVVIVAGCGVDNCNEEKSSHSGVHTFHVGKNSKVKYLERHYGHGHGKKELHPETKIFLSENAEMIMNTVQIEGVDDSNRLTVADIGIGASLVVNEKILTNKKQVAKSEFFVNLVGEDSKLKLSSRAVAQDESEQHFFSDVVGEKACYGHVECDAILSGKAKVSAIPKIVAAHTDAKLIHEATIGKIAGEQLEKLLTLGLSEEEAEKVIIDGFLR